MTPTSTSSKKSLHDESVAYNKTNGASYSLDSHSSTKHSYTATNEEYIAPTKWPHGREVDSKHQYKRYDRHEPKQTKDNNNKHVTPLPLPHLASPHRRIQGTTIPIVPKPPIPHGILQRSAAIKQDPCPVVRASPSPGLPFPRHRDESAAYSSPLARNGIPPATSPPPPAPHNLFIDKKLNIMPDDSDEKTGQGMIIFRQQLQRFESWKKRNEGFWARYHHHRLQDEHPFPRCVSQPISVQPLNLRRHRDHYDPKCHDQPQPQQQEREEEDEGEDWDEEWEEHWDEEVGASYYYNVVTGEACWVKPEEKGGGEGVDLMD